MLDTAKASTLVLVGDVLQSTEHSTEWFTDPVKVLNAFQAISAPAAKAMFEAVRYQGFDKLQFLSAWTVDHGLSVTTLIKIAFISAVRGTAIEKVREAISSDALAIPNHVELIRILEAGAARIRTPAGRMSKEGRRAITIARCGAIVPHIVAATMKLADVPARYPNMSLPAHLQFPAAASLPLSDQARANHRIFNDQFSLTISGGRAVDQQKQNTIYNQQMTTGIAPLVMPRWVFDILSEDLADDVTWQ